MQQASQQASQQTSQQAKGLASVVRYLRHAPISQRVALVLVLGSMVIVGGCGGCGAKAKVSGGSGGQEGVISLATATATTAAPTATHAPAATATHAPASTPTKTPVPPTPTPVPPLQGQVVTQGLGAVSPLSNSSIVDLSCPSGYLVAGGGFNSGYTTFNIMWDAPISTTTWQGEIFNTSASQTIYAQLQVECLKVSGLVGQVVTQGLGTVGSHTNSSIVTVSCPAGYLVAGGGINTGYGTLVTMSNVPTSTTTWREEVYNSGSASASAQVQVECLQVSGLVGQVVVTGLGTVSPGTNSTITDTSCPSGYLVAGGGLSSGYATQTLMQSDPISASAWRSEVYNTGGSSISAQAQVECLKR